MFSFLKVFQYLAKSGWEERLRNDLFCVGWDVKPNSINTFCEAAFCYNSLTACLKFDVFADS